MANKKSDLIKRREEFLKREQLRKQEELKRRKAKRRKILIIAAEVMAAIAIIVVFAVLFSVARGCEKAPSSSTVKACDGCSGDIPVELCDCNRECGEKNCECPAEPHDDFPRVPEPPLPIPPRSYD